MDNLKKRLFTVVNPENFLFRLRIINKDLTHPRKVSDMKRWTKILFQVKRFLRTEGTRSVF